MNVRMAVTVGVALLWAAGWAQGADDNPYKKADVGDWVEYTTAVDAMGVKMNTKVKQTLTAKEEKSVTVKIETEAAGQKNSQDIKIELDKPYEQPKQAGTEVKKIGEGDETVKVGDKEYKCHWIENEVTGNNITAKQKVWSCPSVPLSGMVKMTMDSTMEVGGNKMASKMEMVLSGCGKGK